MKREMVQNKTRLLLFAILAAWLITGCAHGKGTSRISPDGSYDSDQLTELSPTDDAAETDASTKKNAGKESPEPVPAETDPEPGDEDFFDDEGDEDFFNDEGEDSFFDDEETFTEEPLVADPLSGWNRAMFTFNDRLYFWCLKPVSKGYTFITPSFFRKGVRNFFHNLTTPIRFVSSVLQGKVKGAGSEVGRFLVNTTVGVAGVWDPAEMYLGWQSSEEDLGQTFGAYNIGNGFYIVWPVLGPSTLRDSVGLVGDSFLNPVSYVKPYELALGINAYEKLNAISFRIGDYEAVKAASLDPYVMVRDFYIEYRKKRVAE